MDNFFTRITRYSHALTLLALIVIPLFFLFLGLQYFNDAIKVINQLTQVNKQAETTNSTVPNGGRQNRLSELTYHNIDLDLSTLVASESPREALQRLNSLMDESPLVLKECHGFVHDIGHFAIEKYNDIAKALSYQDDLCGSGYIHGIIEEYLANTKDVFSAMQTLCTRYGLESQAGKCYHGIGHGLMYYTSNDLPKALSYCDTYTKDAKTRCAEGVFMENFGSLRSLHPSIYLNESNTLFPCSQQQSSYKAACYYYAPLFYLNLHDEDYKGALQVCSHAEKAYRDLCTKGVGSRIMKQHFTKPLFVESMCKTGTSGQYAPCIDGVASYALVNFDSVSKAKAFCLGLSKSSQDHCLVSVNAQKYLATE